MSDLAELERWLREAAAVRERIAWSRTDGGQEWTLEAMLAEEAADAVAVLTRTREELEAARRERDEAYELVAAYAADSVLRADFDECQAAYERLSDALDVTHAELPAAREALAETRAALLGARWFVSIYRACDERVRILKRIDAALSSL